MNKTIFFKQVNKCGKFCNNQKNYNLKLIIFTTHWFLERLKNNLAYIWSEKENGLNLVILVAFWVENILNSWRIDRVTERLVQKEKKMVWSILTLVSCSFVSSISISSFCDRCCLRTSWYKLCVAILIRPSLSVFSAAVFLMWVHSDSSLTASLWALSSRVWSPANWLL